MYHYIRNNANFKALNLNHFRNQLQHLCNKYKIISLKELIKNKSFRNTCVLTFDDGLKDGLVNALPILEEFNLKATFFIPTKILVTEKLLSVQKRHLILAKLGAEKFVKEFNKLSEDIFHIERTGKTNGYDDDLTSNLKWVLDNMDQLKSTIYLNKIFNKYFDEKREFKKIYLTKRDINKLDIAGMEIGVHGHEHLHFANVSFNEMQSDILKSVEIFKENFDSKDLVISYPFGSYSLFTLRLCHKLGFMAGVTTIKKDNTSADNPLELGRYDCIDNEKF
ncbi:MAG: polysaccharide deacetylase family protein [archaeon]